MPEDTRVVDSTGALELKEVPKRMLILGGGIIGLEMGTVNSTLGARPNQRISSAYRITHGPFDGPHLRGFFASAPGL